MKNFRTYELAKTFYQKGLKIKFSNLILKDQFERASLSIVLNLAEGYGRETIKDRKRFYVIAFGSLRETQSILDLMGEEILLKESDKLAAYLFKLIQNPGSLKLNARVPDCPIA